MLSGFGHAYHRLPDAWQVFLGEHGSGGRSPREANIAGSVNREIRVCPVATARTGVTGQLGHGIMVAVGTPVILLAVSSIVRSRAFALSLAVLAAACTSARPEGSQPSPSGPGSTGATESPAPSDHNGFLGVSLRVRYEDTIFTEGALAFIEVRDPFGRVVGRDRSKQARVVLPLQLAPGDYEVRTYLRPCDGSCSALDPARDQCRVPVEIPADDSPRFVSIEVVAVVGECQVSDQGAAVFEASRPRSPSVGVGQPNPIKLLTHCGIEQAAVDFDENWWDLVPTSVRGGDFNDPFTKGTMTLMPEGTATFDAPPQGLSRHGVVARFVRHEGPIRLPGCY